MTSDDANFGHQDVFTLKQTAEILGTTENSVRRLAERATERGLKISWVRDSDDNPIFPAYNLYLAYWVEMEAKRTNRTTDGFIPTPVYLGGAKEVSQYLPAGSVKVPAVAAEEGSRYEEFLHSADAALREAHAEEVRRIEVERDAARTQLVEARAEIERLRTMVAASVGAVRLPEGPTGSTNQG